MIFDFHGVEYKPYSDNNIAEFVNCPYYHKWIENIECDETRSGHPISLTRDENWIKVCRNCPFQNY